MPAMNLHLAHPSAWGTEQGIHRAMRARPPPPSLPPSMVPGLPGSAGVGVHTSSLQGDRRNVLMRARV